MSKILTREDFADKIGQKFTLMQADFEVAELGDITLELTACDAMKDQEFEGKKRSPFSLTLKGPESPCFPQGYQSFTHDAMGTVKLFLLPLGPQDGAMMYKVIYT